MNYNGAATARWVDSTVAHVNGAEANQSFVFVYHALLSGTMDASASNRGEQYSSYLETVVDLFSISNRADIDIQKQNNGHVGYLLERTGEVEQKIPALNDIRIAITYRNDQVSNFDIALSTTFRGEMYDRDYTVPGSVDSFFATDFTHTLTWGGLLAVTDGQGNPVDLSNVTITSESGFDYKQPSSVPLPPAAWMFGSGLAAMMSMRRKSSS
jgi:hypothetical protein